ncbi:MAG: RNA polymerase factor sigma-54 [Bacteroidota bacterium]|jgi:RNA polymerase sigma-54 factor|nr:RNA polymerase factor sigma-54 [Bacteroidota bacterium]|tara:strand:+ start:375 stop:1745 length:1371 start_codon:yes stop_codon:yes gene_type:complete
MQKLQLRQNQSQKLSPQQIQFIKLLQLSNSNIEAEIKKEIEENPALEENEKNENIDTVNTENYNYYQKSNNENSNFNREENISNTESFRENLISQLNYQKLDKGENIIANQIIGTLDNDGYLRRDIESIIDDIAFAENIEFKNSDIEKVLLKIQKLEPAGIAARNLEECLILQIDSIEEPTQNQLLAKKIILENFKEFTNKKFDVIYQKYDHPKNIINNAFDYIKTLNPKPSGGLEDSNLTEFLIPDFIVKKDNNEFIVELASGNKPLNINKNYISIYDELKNKKNKDNESKESFDFIKSKLEKAQWFVEALNQRNNTLLKTMNTIVKIQKRFFNDGDENDLKPMILKDIAEIIKMDISTVSRIVKSKNVQTDYGIFPLRYFFSESTIKKGDDLVSSKIVKNYLSDLIENEDKSSPYSDDQLEKILKKEGYDVARRTVAKYREQLNIPVARLRKEY